MELRVNWNIDLRNFKEEERYCHNCNGKVLFKDSGIRRQNANGKNIYHYAIYKCINGHTWNKKLETFKTLEGVSNDRVTREEKKDNITIINIKEVKKESFSKIIIKINILGDKIRIDKLLSDNIMGINRNYIIDLIDSGDILLNNKKFKKSSKITGTNNIIIDIHKVNFN
ncbi:hypothetical protein [Clostridium hydrogeniformans]|uniref:hypothetical protein n=1 Tax=Clostridium hydrogeniformans TaxID=349933 RepID=UPI000484B8C5|nr:hypothetical protein [Clostridium hydrogeniformans]